MNRPPLFPVAGGLALALLAAAGLAQPAVGQTSAAVQLVADHWATDTLSYDWGNNLGAGLRFRAGEKYVRGIVSLDVMPVGHGPLFFTLTLGAHYGPRGEHEGPWPYAGLAGACIVDAGRLPSGVAAAPGRGVCSYALTLGIMRSRPFRREPFLELQFYLKDTVRRVSLTFGIYQ